MLTARANIDGNAATRRQRLPVLWPALPAKRGAKGDCQILKQRVELVPAPWGFRKVENVACDLVSKWAAWIVFHASRPGISDCLQLVFSKHWAGFPVVPRIKFMTF